MKVAVLLLILLTVAFAAEPCVAGDWPGYRGPNQDGSVDDFDLPAAWPEQLTAKWKVGLGEGYGSPAVAGGRVFVMAQSDRDEVVHCLDAATGAEKWKHTYAARYGSVVARNGPRSTPAVDGDRVYTVGATGEMHCLKVADGQVVWKTSFREAFRMRRVTFGLSTSPLIDGERVIVHVGGREGNSVVAMNKLTGNVVWKSQSDPAGYASPILVPASKTRGPRQLIVLTDEAVVSLNPDSGAFYWRYPWRMTFGENIAQPMLDGDRLYVTSQKGLAALKLVKTSGRPLFIPAYRNKAMAVNFSCPITHAGFMYGAHGGRAEMRCVDLTDGTVKWTQSLSGGSRAGVVRVGSQLLIYTENGKLVVVDADPKAYRKRAEYSPAGFNWSPPVVANGCLYLRDAKSLRCVPLPTEAPR